MKRLIAISAVCLGFASAATAQTLTIIPDKAEYEVGELIQLTVIGDPQGGEASTVFGRLSYSPSLGVAVGVQTIQQNTPAGNAILLPALTSQGGTLVWTPGLARCGVFACDVINQTQGATTFTPDGPVISIGVLFANLPGTVNLDWLRTGGAALKFFGVTPENSPGATVTILPPPFVPVIDIKPTATSEPEGKNKIKLDGNIVPVGIIGTDTFDVATIDADTIRFGPADAAPIHSGFPHIADFNADGITDFLAHFSIADTGIQFGDFTACITGELLDGTRLEGCDNITVELSLP